MANENHWRAEPGKIAGRPIMDCSNAQSGIIPLNTETTKQMGIARYQKVVLPTLREVVEKVLTRGSISSLDLSVLFVEFSECDKAKGSHPIIDFPNRIMFMHTKRLEHLTKRFLKLVSSMQCE